MLLIFIEMMKVIAREHFKIVNICIENIQSYLLNR